MANPGGDVTTFFTTAGNVLELDSLLGKGGEGSVYLVKGNHDLAAKIYDLPHATRERQHKLICMVANPPVDPCRRLHHVSIAWPSEIIYQDKNRQSIAGFLMAALPRAKTVADVFHVPTRRMEMPGFTWEYLLCAARNLASSLQALHDKGYVVGDLNESNALIFPSAVISIIDTDSFQVRSNTDCFRCEVGRPAYTAPECQGKDFSTFDRLPVQDCFALAVLVYQLLMEGRHPFAGVPVAVPDQPEVTGRIHDNWFREVIVSPKRRVTPPDKCPPFSLLPDLLQHLFIRSFVDGEYNPNIRPTAIEWMDALDAVMGTLATCSANPLHRYGGHLPACPWCERMSNYNLPDPFPVQRPKSALKKGRTAGGIQPTPQQAVPVGAGSPTTHRTTRKTTLPPAIPIIPGPSAIPGGVAPAIPSGISVAHGKPVPSSAIVPAGTHVASGSTIAAGASPPPVLKIPPSMPAPSAVPIPSGIGVPAAFQITAGISVPSGSHLPPDNALLLANRNFMVSQNENRLFGVALPANSGEDE